MNKVTIKDACILPNLEEFIKEFTSLLYISVLNMFSGYNQVKLTIESCNLTGF